MRKKDPALLIGRGKASEIKEQLRQSQAGTVIFDHPLTGVQIRNLRRFFKAEVMDRHQLILNIFAGRAKTYAGKLQVEMARLMDELPRLTGAWHSSLSRQGGRRGAKGPGEKAIEKDRRLIKKKLAKMRKKLEQVHRVQKENRFLRAKNKVLKLALVGCTNSGKSTLLNALAHKLCAPAKNLPFMTLDPTTRKVYIPQAGPAVLTDTVGFIQNLSPHLIQAFKAALEESALADILLHVIDAESPLRQMQIETVEKLLKDFGWDQKPCVYVYNKMDKIENGLWPSGPQPKVFVSALKKTGLNQLQMKIGELAQSLNRSQVDLYFSKQQEDHIYTLSLEAEIYKKEHSSLGTLCKAYLPHHCLKKWKKFMVKKSNYPG